MGSGTLSLPYYGCFSPFPHGTGSLSVSREYLALPDGPGGFTQDYSCPALLRNTPGISNNRGRGLSPAMAELSRSSPLMQETPKEGPTTPNLRRHRCGLGCSPVARHYWGNHCCFLLLEVLRCFSSLGSPPQASSWGYPPKGGGLSHSEIRASKVICTYTRLIAAYHVLHRLREPRHPPCALAYFLLCWTRRIIC